MEGVVAALDVHLLCNFPVSGTRSKMLTGESAYGMSGSACREVTRLHSSDTARSREKEQQKEEGRGRVVRVVRVPEHSSSVGKASQACPVGFRDEGQLHHLLGQILIACCEDKMMRFTRPNTNSARSD